MMKTLFAATALLASVALGIDYETEDSVIVLGDDTFDGAIAAHEHILVEFYAPWCGHCKSLAPEYAKAAEFFEDSEEFNVALAKVDATEHADSAGKFGVSGYPTLKFFKDGEVQDFTGGRTADEIIAWLKKKTGPAAVVIDNATDLAALKEAEQVVVVIAAEDITTDNTHVANFLKYAGSEDNAAFALTTDFSLLDVEQGDADFKVVLFKQYDEGRADFDKAKVTKTKLSNFVTPHLLPYVVEFNDEVASKVFGGAVKEHMLYFRDPNTDVEEAVFAAYREVAIAHKGELLFVAVDMTSPGNKRIADFFGLNDDAVPAVRIININSTPVKYAPAADFGFDGESFEALVSSYVAGDLAPHLNSEEVPENWDEEEVKILVGKNFKEVALDESKNVFLMAHAPWCGHCKSLSPVWDQLAEEFDERDDVIIAKMDATANEVEAFSAQSFPTIKFFPAGSQKVEDYDGGRTLEDLTKFINEKIGSDAAEEATEDAADDEL